MSWQSFAFHAGIKSVFYGAAVKPVGPMIWAYEGTTGKNVPFLIEAGLQVGLPVALGVADEAFSIQWKQKGHSWTWKAAKAGGRVVKGGFLGSKKAAAATTRAFARGTVKVLTRVGFRIIPVVGLTMLAYDVYRLMQKDSFRKHVVDTFQYDDWRHVRGPIMPVDVPHPSTWPVPSWRDLPGAPR